VSLPLGEHFHNNRGAGAGQRYAAVESELPDWTRRSAGWRCPSRPAPPATSPPRTGVPAERQRHDVDIACQAAIDEPASPRGCRHDGPVPCCVLVTGMPALMPADGTSQAALTAKGRQTGRPFEQRPKTVRERGFHGNHMPTSTSAAVIRGGVSTGTLKTSEDLLDRTAIILCRSS